MLPTLHAGDVVLVDRLSYRFRRAARGDVVVFAPPIPSRDDLVERIVGTPGDTFEIKSGVTIVDGKPLSEPYLDAKTGYDMVVRNYGFFVNFGSGWHRLDPSAANIPAHSSWSAPDRLPRHCYVVLGDNRNDSEDSHIWGCAKDAAFTGRVVRIVAPPERARAP